MSTLLRKGDLIVCISDISALFCLFCSQPLQPDEQEISWSHCVLSCTKLFEEHMRKKYSDQIKRIQGFPKKNVLRDTGFVVAPISHLHVKLLQWKKLSVSQSPMPQCHNAKYTLSIAKIFFCVSFPIFGIWFPRTLNYIAMTQLMKLSFCQQQTSSVQAYG